jgi:hypothetical protein
MTVRTASLLADALIIASIESRLAVSAQDTPDRSVLMLRVVRDVGEEYGTSVLIHRNESFMTRRPQARPFSPPAMTSQAVPRG